MSPTHNNVKSLSNRIFRSVLTFTLIVLFVFGTAMSAIFYTTYERDAEEGLSSAAQNVATSLGDLDSQACEQALSRQFSDAFRYTLIDTDGTVLYDSVADASTMENHADRPEVREADERGRGEVSRYSSTLGTVTLYSAVKLQNGDVVRLSETRESLVAFFGGMMGPIALTLLVAIMLVFLLSQRLTSRIMQPIDVLDFANPLENEIYEEMDPLLERIDDQQRQLREQNKDLARAETMRRDFSSNVSHEMKTPLQVISGYAELMRNDMVDPADRQKFAGLIYDEAQSMRALIDEVLTLSRLDETSFDGESATLIDMLEASKRVAGRLSSFAHDRGVSVEVSGDSACIAGSETLVEEMLYNLVENGIRYNHEGGSVSVSVRLELPTSAEQADDIRELPAGERGRMRAVVRVSDTGPGIPEDKQEKIFERFYRLEKSRSKETGGTGLGLAIVKHAVMYHKGSVRVESEEGKGTVFILRIPTA